MEHSANILEPNKSLISSSLKVFVMFQLRIFYYLKYEKENGVGYIAIKCIDFNKDTGLYVKDTIIE